MAIKKEYAEKLSRLADVPLPSSIGGTIQRKWLADVIRAVGILGPVPDQLGKLDLLRWALEKLSVDWRDSYASSVGSTITGGGLKALFEALSRSSAENGQAANSLWSELSADPKSNLGGSPLQSNATSYNGSDTVDIRPGIAVLSVLRHLNYKPWFAIAEFVDNSLQSFLTHHKRLAGLGQEAVTVFIEIDSSDPASITVRDDAAGISLEEFPRAFRPAQVPPDRDGLSEFGMGMKSAACWFAPKWQVSTSALGETVVRTVRFDIDNIVESEIEALEIEAHETDGDLHFTEVVLHEPFTVPVGRTIAKLKDHLTDIYRKFLREGSLHLVLNGQELAYVEPPVLSAPYYETPSAEPIVWRRRVQIEVGEGKAVEGFVGLLEKGSTAKAGFSLFRRGRVIEGSGDERYRPPDIFGGPNSFRYQRLFGELHFSGFEVSHTKDGIKWGDTEGEVIAALKQALSDSPHSFLKQADGYRARADPRNVRRSAESALDAVVDAIRENVPAVSFDSEHDDKGEVPQDAQPEGATETEKTKRQFSLAFLEQEWHITVSVQYAGSYQHWLTVSMGERAVGSDIRKVDVGVSAVHPFMQRFVHTDREDMEALLRVAAAIALAEVAARESGVPGAGRIRVFLNEILAKALSGPN